MALIHDHQVYVSGLPARNLRLPPRRQSRFFASFSFPHRLTWRSPYRKWPESETFSRFTSHVRMLTFTSCAQASDKKCEAEMPHCWRVVLKSSLFPGYLPPV